MTAAALCVSDCLSDRRTIHLLHPKGTSRAASAAAFPFSPPSPVTELSSPASPGGGRSVQRPFRPACAGAFPVGALLTHPPACTPWLTAISPFLTCRLQSLSLSRLCWVPGCPPRCCCACRPPPAASPSCRGAVRTGSDSPSRSPG